MELDGCIHCVHKFPIKSNILGKSVSAWFKLPPPTLSKGELKLCAFDVTWAIFAFARNSSCHLLSISDTTYLPDKAKPSGDRPEDQGEGR